jgi:predicted transcriptional regulator
MDDEFVIDLDDETLEMLKRLADKAGMSPDDLAGQILNDFMRAEHEVKATPVDK